jgi:hypothetical protein
MRATADDEAAAMLLHQRQDLPAVFGIGVRVMDLDVGDEIGGHGLDLRLIVTGHRRWTHLQQSTAT